jgi:hypothetical protein|tara:strand:- start:143 stop:496 length:354 start_codon:yes stop_codon:yes gene_type:complete
MDYSNTSQQPPVEKKETSLTEHASNAWSGFTKMFEKSDSNPSANPNTNPSAPIGGKRRRRKSMKGGNPKKGMKSRTRKGRKDFVTHKGDKYYNRKGKRQSRSRSGRKGRPYSRRSRK